MRLGRVFDWYLHSRILGVCLFAAGASLCGVGVAQAVAPAGTAKAVITHTLTNTATRTIRHTRLVTVRVKGRVIRHHDHVLVVQVPRVVFVNHVTHRRVVVPSHVVKIQEPTAPFGPPVAAVIGVAPPPVTVTEPTTITVTVPVPVDVPTPPVTVTSVTTQTQTETLPQDTTTVYVTVTEPPPPSS